MYTESPPPTQVITGSGGGTAHTGADGAGAFLVMALLFVAGLSALRAAALGEWKRNRS